MSIRVGSNIRSLYATSAGKALLGCLDERALRAYLKTAVLKRNTPFTVASRTALREQLDAGRKRGYYVNREESIEGVTTLSAPFRWRDALFLVTVAGPTTRIEPQIASAAQQVLEVCRQLEMHQDPSR